jgi:hypothetical protein
MVSQKKILIIFMIKLAIFVIIPEIKYIQVHQYSPKGTPHYVSDKYIAPDEQDTYKVEDANVDYGTDSNGVKKREPRKIYFLR